MGVVREGNKAELVPIILGKDYGNLARVWSLVTAENDAVISNPSDSLSSGATVQVVNSSDVR